MLELLVLTRYLVVLLLSCIQSLALGFVDDFASFQGSGKGVTLVVMTVDTAAESSKSAAKQSAPSLDIPRDSAPYA